MSASISFLTFYAKKSESKSKNNGRTKDLTIYEEMEKKQESELIVDFGILLI